MKKKACTFYEYKRKDINDCNQCLNIPPGDDKTTTIYIDTPEGWKCNRKWCTISHKHTHSTFQTL